VSSGDELDTVSCEIQRPRDGMARADFGGK
jgi:hypothetical protein